MQAVKVPDKPSNSSNQPSTSVEPIEEKMNYVMEDVSKYLVLFVTIYIILILSQSPQINSYIIENGGSFDYSDLIWIFPGILMSWGLLQICTRYLAHLLKPYLTKVNYRESEDESQRLHRIGTSIMGIIYYVWSFVTLFYLSYGTEFLPTIYGGDMRLWDTHTTWPNKTSKAIKIVYLLGLGHHLERLISHMIESKHSKSFYTMNLHHVLTVYLISLSFFMNHFIFGVAVFLLHDLSDALLWASRLLRETIFERTTLFVFIAMYFSWLATRVYAYIVEVVFQFFLLVSSPKKYFKAFYFSHVFFFTSLSVLAALNVYWGFQIGKIAFSKFVKKQNSFAFEDTKRKKKN
jgi:hypothetical protein